MNVMNILSPSPQGASPLANPHGDHMCSKPIMAIQPPVADLLFSRGAYIKKLIEDCNNSEETPKLLKVCTNKVASIKSFK